MTTATMRLWQTELLRGSVTLLFGVIFLLFHVHTLHLLLSLLGGYFFLDGITDLIGLLTRHGVYRRAWLDGLVGVGSVILGGITFIWPHITLFFLLRLLAIRLMLRGVSMLRQAWRGLGIYAGVTWLSGFVLTLSGLLLLVLPQVTLNFLLIFIPVYAIVDGGNLFVRGLLLRFAPAAYHRLTVRRIAYDADIPAYLPTTTRRGVVFVRRGAAAGLGHIGWAFEWPTGWFNAGAVENLGGKRVASPDTMDFWTMHALDPVAAMQQQPAPYDEYKVFYIAHPQPKAAWKTVVWESRTPYSVVRHNCNDVAYDVLRAYGVGALLDPAAEVIPNDWYDTLPGTSFTIAEHPVIPLARPRPSTRPVATTALDLAIPAHISGTIPAWRTQGHRAWDELTLAWGKMLKDVGRLLHWQP